MYTMDYPDTVPGYVPGKGWWLADEIISPEEAERILRGMNIPFRKPDPGFRSLKPILSVEMAGMCYIDHVEENLAGLRPGDYLELSRERDNGHDRNAVAIMRDGTKVGYIPRVDNKVIANMMDQDIELFCRLSSVDEGRRYASVCLFLESDTPPAYLHYDGYRGLSRVPFGWDWMDKLTFGERMDEGTWHRGFTEEELWHLQWGADDCPMDPRRGLICDEKGTMHLVSLLAGCSIVTIHPGKNGEHCIEYETRGCITDYDEGLAEARELLDYWFDVWTRPIEMSLEDMPCGVQGNIVPFGRFPRPDSVCRWVFDDIQTFHYEDRSGDPISVRLDERGREEWTILGKWMKSGRRRIKSPCYCSKWTCIPWSITSTQHRTSFWMKKYGY